MLAYRRATTLLLVAALALIFFTTTWYASYKIAWRTAVQISNHVPAAPNGNGLAESDASPLDKSTVRSRIAKVTSLYYNETTPDSQAYERALLSHVVHNERFGYQHFVLRRSIIQGHWTKPALLLHYLIRELAKSPAERLDWLCWFDADVVLVNNQIPLEVFLPPEPPWSHINLVVTNDLNGLNNGIFFLRICEWSVQLFAALLAYRTYNPDVHLQWSDQSAMNLIIQEPRWTNETMHVPQRWFNSFHNFGTDDDIPPEWHWTNGYHEPGDLLVHFPGTGDSRSQLIDEWLVRLQTERDEYSSPLDSSRQKEIKVFWDDEAENEAERQEEYWRRYHLLQDTGGEQDRLRDEEIEETKASMEDKTEEQIDRKVDKIKQKAKQAKIAALRKAEKALLGQR